MFCDFSAGFEVEMSMVSAPIQMFYTSERLTLLIKNKTMTLKIQYLRVTIFTKVSSLARVLKRLHISLMLEVLQKK